MDTSWTRKAKDTSAGFVGGAVQVLVGQPFDLVKVRMQTGQYNSISSAVVQTLKNEGPLAFYKGTSAPLFGVGLCVSLQFYAFHETKRLFQRLNNSSQVSLGQVYLSGAAAGVANTLVVTPVEHMRILMQTQSTKQFSGPFEAARAIAKQYGISKVYRGLLITTLREIQSYGVWFAAFEFLISTQTSKGIDRKDIPAWKLMSFGALAGEALWLGCYPLDVIKSKIQGDQFGAAAKYRGSLDALRDTLRTTGIKGLFAGLTPTLLRAIPASACTFASVELTLRALG